MRQNRTIKALTYLMFMMFALTTESVGLIIPEVMRAYHLDMAASGAFHYAPMTAIALSGLALGFLADRLGRKRAIMLGLVLFAADAYLFAAVDSYGAFLVLLSISGIAIGIFKTGALALVGDIVRSARDHTATMNMVEGFFGVGSIVGPAIVAKLLQDGFAWKWLYVIAGTLCCILLAVAARTDYPVALKSAVAEPVTPGRTLMLLRQPLALGFSLGCFLYVAIECSIYVWLPTYLSAASDRLPVPALWVVPVFFLLRAGGRFLGAWLLERVSWTACLLVFSVLILGCFCGAIAGGSAVASILLPLSGLFMSVMYPTLNSKGISCYPKSEHGAVAGILLFFTCLGAGLGPLAMGMVGDWYGDPLYCFVVAAGCAALLCAGLAYNWLVDPIRDRLAQLDRSEYAADGQGGTV